VTGLLRLFPCKVVNVWGKAIPGLFAVGDCAGGLTPTTDMGGTHLGPGFVLARRQ